MNQFHCTNEACIPISWACDGVNDCGDRSDENDTTCNTGILHYFNFKQYFQTLCTILALNFLGCLGPETSWEDLESNYDHVLNVFWLMNLDSGQTSFIGLYRTTDLDELSQNFVGVDTVGYYEFEDDEEKEGEDGYWVIDSIYEPAALIRDATVLVLDDQ